MADKTDERAGGRPGCAAGAARRRLRRAARRARPRRRRGGLAAIFERYRAPLLRYCRGYLQPAAAEDALQQTFINAYAALSGEGGRAPVSLRPWLYRVAHNAALNVARDPQAGLEELPEGLDGVERPDEVVQRRERLRRVVGAVTALPPKQRQVIVRHALDGDSHERIATDLGVSPGAIRQLAHRARRTVREAAAACSRTAPAAAAVGRQRRRRADHGRWRCGGQGRGRRRRDGRRGWGRGRGGRARPRPAGAQGGRRWPRRRRPERRRHPPRGARLAASSGRGERRDAAAVGPPRDVRERVRAFSGRDSSGRGSSGSGSAGSGSSERRVEADRAQAAPEQLAAIAGRPLDVTRAERESGDVLNTAADTS